MATPRSAGRVLIRPSGDYDASTTYEMLDLVEYAGTSYICKQTSQGHLPTDTAYWQVLAEPLIIVNSDGDPMPHRGNLKFANATVTDDAENDTTVITNSGLHIGDVENFSSSASPGIKKISLTWDDPDDIVISGVVQAAWGGTKIVRKAGSIPVSEGDGIIVVDSTTRNQYSITGFEDNTVEFETTYYYRAFPYTTEGTVTAGSYISDMAAQASIYGAEWDGTATTAWTRTDEAADFTDPEPAVNNGTGSSPFDNIMPWAGMQIVQDSEAGTLVSIPKYWYKWTRTGTAMKLQIADGPEEGFLVSPAHADRGDGKGERDIVYVGRYHCGLSYKSVNGQSPKRATTRAGFRTNIHNLGSTIWQYDFAMYWTIMMLYLVEYANWNSQATIGYGCSPSGSLFNMGYTDNMQYHTGTTAADRTTYGGTQYRYIEGLWDNVLDWCDGIYFSGTNKTSIYCIKNPANFSDTSGGTLVGTRTTNTGFIRSWTNPTTSGFEYALYPNAVNANSSDYINVYVCDRCDYYYTGVVLHVGGSNSKDPMAGAFYLDGSVDASTGGSSSGSRLMKLPNNT